MRPLWTRPGSQPSPSADGESVRILDNSDRDQVMQILARRPVENLFVAARIAQSGVDPLLLGCSVFGYFEHGELVSLLHAGSNVVPVDAGPKAIKAFAEALGRRRNSAAIMGNAEQVHALWQALVATSSSWNVVRDTRWHQPLMVIDAEPQVASDPRVERIGMEHFQAYFDAAVAMYTEEVGVSPLDSSGSYSAYVRSLIDRGRAFGIVDDDGTVIFKSDVGSALGGVCQVQGVWMHPRLRGQRASIPAMAEVVRLCREYWPTVSLYVNDFNTRARRLYETVGFSTQGELATVLY